MNSEQARIILKFHRPDRPRNTERKQLQQAIDVILGEERPQGEWELIANDTVNLEYIYKCSECGREVRVYNASALTDIYPFCHCGADMRKGGAE